MDATIVQRQEELSRAELENVAFTHPAILLKALEQLPAYLKVVASEAALFKQMLKVTIAALPKADAAVEKFTKGEWADANDRFDGLFGDDPVAKCFVRHMTRTNGTPTNDWTGAFTPRPKE